MRKEKLEELKGYIEEFKTIKVEELENPGFLTIHKRLYTLQNGKQVTREILKKNKKDGSAAIILPLTKDLETILVIEPRVATKEGVGISLPAGYIEEGEDPVVAAQRELREETGFEASRIEEICSYYQDEGISGAFNHSFIAYDVEQKHEQDHFYHSGRSARIPGCQCPRCAFHHRARNHRRAGQHFRHHHGSG